MKITKKQILMMLVTSSVLFSSAANAMPPIKFKMSSFIDDVICSAHTYNNITDAWREDAYLKVPELEKTWNTTAPGLFDAVEEMTGRPFPNDGYTVRYFYCSDEQAWAFPAIFVPIWPYLKIPTSGKIASNDLFVVDAFYQILRHYSLRTLGIRFFTPLIRRYSNESWTTRLNLHALALLKAAYLKVQMPHIYKQYTNHFAETRPIAYTKAVGIVETEGSAAFIEELPRR